MGTFTKQVGEPPPASRYCPVGTILHGDSFDDEDRSTFLRWVESTASGDRIAEALRTIGHRVGKDTIKRHLVGGCDCPDDACAKGARRG